MKNKIDMCSTQVEKREFDLATRLLSVSSTESYSSGNYTEHYGYGPGILVGWIRHIKNSIGGEQKTYHLTEEARKSLLTFGS